MRPALSRPFGRNHPAFRHLLRYVGQLAGPAASPVFPGSTVNRSGNGSGRSCVPIRFYERSRRRTGGVGASEPAPPGAVQDSRPWSWADHLSEPVRDRKKELLILLRRYGVDVLAQGAQAPDESTRDCRGWQPVQAGPSPGGAVYGRRLQAEPPYLVLGDRIGRSWLHTEAQERHPATVADMKVSDAT